MKQLLTGIGLGLLLFISSVASSPALAASFSINESFPANGQTNVPVNLIGGSFLPSWNLYALQTIGFKLNPIGASNCAPVTSSFNKNSVELTSSSDPGTYLMSTVTSGLGASPSWLGIGSSTAGFELLPTTTYNLFLTTATSIKCGGVTLPLDSAYQLSFTTGTDTVAPQILGPQISTTSTTATFSWETFQAADGKVSYGQNSLSTTAGDTSMGKLHRVKVANLNPGTFYRYRLQSTDPAHNTGYSQELTFTTTAIAAVTVSDVTDMAATLTWTSNQPTDSLVEFGTSEHYGNRQGNGGQLTNHSLRLVGLKPDQTYHFRVVATNSAGSSTFTDNIFATAASASVAGASTGNDQISRSNENIKLFPYTSFAQPLVLGAATAADTVTSSIALGKNMLIDMGLPASSWPGWLIMVLWLIPLGLIMAIMWFGWHSYRNRPRSSSTFTPTPVR